MGSSAPIVDAESTPTEADRLTDAPPLTGTVRVFDPAMCCDTGVCGPAVDPALLAAARDLRWLTARGVQVSRHNLGQEPLAFVHFAPVQTLLTERGVDALPATWVNDVLLVSGRHATREELVAALDRTAEAA
jgi:hypothetical protein